MSTHKVAVLGLGLMGAGMAASLLRAGFETTVWNRDSAKAEPLVAAGAVAAATPAEAVRDADVVVAMLAHDDASRAAWLDGGALAAMRSDAVATESSTLTLEWVRDLAARATGRGLGFLDAPVTGSRDQAATGTLRFLVGGDAGTLERARPVLMAMGDDIVPLGPTGSGALLKLVNNFLCGVQAASAAEAVAMIEAGGLDPAAAVAVLVNGAPGSPMLGGVTARMLARDYDPRFKLPLMAKDLAYAEAAFADAGIALPSAAAARELFTAAAAHDDLRERDIAAVVEVLRRAKGA